MVIPNFESVLKGTGNRKEERENRGEMKKLILTLAFLLIATSASAYSQSLHVLIYCDYRAPGVIGELKEHWKPEIPSLGPMVIRDFMIVASQGSKRMFHCLINKDSNWAPVKNYIDNHPELGILYWWGKSARKAYKSLWQDNLTIAKRVLRYEVCVGDPCENRTVTVYDAETVYGETIDTNKILPAMDWFTSGHGIEIE